MLRIWTLLAALILVTSSLFGQDSRIEVFGGYSYLSIDVNDLGNRQSANGWRAAVSINAYRRFAIEGAATGNYKTYTDVPVPLLGTRDVKVSDYAFLGGPRINLRPFFIHGLVGVDHLTGSASVFSASQNSFAGSFGAGIEWKLAEHWSAQGSGDYVLTRHNILGGDRMTQNNVNIAAGIVYSFGHVGRPQARREPERPSGSVPIPALGIAASTDEHGVLVSDVTGGGRAALAGLRPGDVITAVNGQTVKTAAELAAALQPGQAKLSFLVHGTWQAEAVVTIGGQP